MSIQKKLKMSNQDFNRPRATGGDFQSKILNGEFLRTRPGRNSA
jgi:hypothetical protein